MAAYETMLERKKKLLLSSRTFSGMGERLASKPPLKAQILSKIAQ